jgi:hypothetical protein
MEFGAFIAMAAEQFGQSAVVSRQDMHGQVLRPARHPAGVAALGDADLEHRRVHTGLVGETDQATRRLAFGLGCHHEHRVIQHAHQVIERFIDHGTIINPLGGFEATFRR